MGKVTKKEMPMWAKSGHKAPVTRREFLAAGLIPFAASALLPSALTMLTMPAEAFAEGLNCPAGGTTLPAMITINCSGGGALASNFIPFDGGGNALPSYDKMGFPTSPAATLTSQFGITRFAQDCGFINGLTGANSASPEALANSSFIGMCVQSADDSQENKFDISGLAYRAGLVGLTIPNTGTESAATGTGIRQKPSTLAPPPPLVVNNFASLTSAIGYTAALKSKLGAGGSVTAPSQGDKLRNSLTKLVSKLSSSQTRRLASMENAAQFKTLVDCAGIKNVDLVRAGASAIDPLAASEPNAGAIGALYGGINANSNNDSRTISAMVYNALKGNSGTANIELGGFDYHDGSRSTGDGRDTELGQTVGRILQMAHLLQKKVFIYVTSDGSVGSNSGSTVWVSDRGNAGSSYLITYDPAGRRATSSPQIGHFNAGQAAEEGTPVGADPELAGQAAFANYCRFAAGAGWEEVYRRAILRGSGLGDAALASVLKIA